MKILLIADVHNKPNSSEKTLKSLSEVIKNTECDLIVFLGDTVHGPSVKSNYAKYLRQVLDLTDGKKFAFVFGNHDDECETSKDEILSVINEYDNSLINGRDYSLEMLGETLIFLDSGSYYNGRGSYYDTVKQAQIDFAKGCFNGKKAILFQHIIVPDIMSVLQKTRLPKSGSVYSGGYFYKFKKGVNFTGSLYEAPCPPQINTGELEQLAPYVKAMCFGHDHMNTFETVINGVRIIQCGGSGDNSYDKDYPSSVKILDTETLQTRIIYLN